MEAMEAIEAMEAMEDSKDIVHVDNSYMYVFYC